MAVLDQIKSRMISAMKSGNTVERDIMRLIKGETDTENARTGKVITDEDVAKVIRKIVEANTETLKLMTEADSRRKLLNEELSILNDLMPKFLNKDEIIEKLTEKYDDIKNAKNDGQATGIAMKFFKERSILVNGNDVSSAVKQIRN